MSLSIAQKEYIRTEALSWVGTPFHHAARVKGAGVDCAQLLVAVFTGAGIVADYVPAPYAAGWFLHRDQEILLEEVARFAERVEQPWEIGDILLFRYGRCVSHSGIYIGEGLMVHADARIKSVQVGQVESFSTRFHSGWRLRCKLS